MFVGAIERLVSLRLRIPSHADRQRVRGIIDTFERCQIERKPLRGVLIGRDAPPADIRHRRPAKKSLRIFQMLVAAEDLFPLSVIILRDDGAGDDRAGNVVVLRRLGDDVRRQKLLLSIFRQVAEEQHGCLRSRRR